MNHFDLIFEIAFRGRTRRAKSTDNVYSVVNHNHALYHIRNGTNCISIPAGKVKC